MSQPIDSINKPVRDNALTLREKFLGAQPFRHVVIDDFLAPDYAQQLLSEFPAFEAGNRLGDDGRPGGKSTIEQIKGIGAAFAHLDAMVRSAEFLSWLGTVTDIENLLYDPAYFGGGTHNNQSGQELHAHIDFNYHPGTGRHRRLNLIIYLNPGWDREWGGALEFYKDPYSDASPAQSVEPQFNRCVLFETTESSWHGFSKISQPQSAQIQSRKSVAFYFYTDQRPASEVAGRHTTHYVNKQLPEHLVVGHSLIEADIEALRLLIAHRDNLLQRMYAENARLLQAYDKGVAGRVLHLLKRAYHRYKHRD